MIKFFALLKAFTKCRISGDAISKGIWLWLKNQMMTNSINIITRHRIALEP